MADLVTRTLELQLSIGDTIQVGDQFLTVVDIEEGEILFQLDSEAPEGPSSTSVPSTAPYSRSCR